MTRKGNERAIQIHPTALVDKNAQLGEDVEIGPYASVGSDVKIGVRTNSARSDATPWWAA